MAKRKQDADILGPMTIELITQGVPVGKAVKQVGWTQSRYYRWTRQKPKKTKATVIPTTTTVETTGNWLEESFSEIERLKKQLAKVKMVNAQLVRFLGQLMLEDE